MRYVCRMRRSLRPGLLVTFTACAGPVGNTDGHGPIHNPPAPPPVVATFPTGPVAPRQVLNPEDAEGRLIRRSFDGGDCYVELPFAERPTSVRPAPTLAMECPTVMVTDPAWSGCLGGTLQVASVEPLDCVCNFFGNPPPPPKQAACPREVAERLPQPPVPAPDRAREGTIPELGAPSGSP